MNKNIKDLKLKKLNIDSMQNLYGGVSGPDDDWDTGCSTAPDCCTGDNCSDTVPMELDYIKKINGVELISSRMKFKK